ncbi:hypothetical protein QFZ48_003778 [Chitinophaga sp. W2I13]|uniref:outer membrane beta-barrel protein n=1 Tax=Chitinophaga sp. W2I13 TaxID=3373923 RepID=UPI003D1A13A0
MKHWLFLFVTAFLGLSALAQVDTKIELKGQVYSMQGREGLPGASVSLFLSKDSSLIYRTYSDKNGLFKFDSIRNLEYYLLLSYMGYNPVFYQIRRSFRSSVVNLGIITLASKQVTLAEVRIIGNTPPIRVIKDTIEFNAKYYKVRENSVVEDLLRRLPGIHIEPDGTIKMNGETIKTILIDGRPFLSDDPSLVSRNLQADLIDKIQLIDRRVKERDPSVLDDMQTEKVLNISIKKDRIGLWSGSFMIGYGSNNRFAVKSSVNRFEANEQLVFMADGDNVNGFQNIANGGGILRKWTPNFNYTKDISRRVTLNVRYEIEDSRRSNMQSIDRENNIGATYYYNQEWNQRLDNISHAISTRLTYKIDSMSSLIYSSYFAYGRSLEKTTSDNFIYGDQNQLLDSGMLDNKDKRDAFSLSNGVSFERRFGGNRQKLNVEFSYSDTKRVENGFNFSNTLYAQVNGENRWDTINQFNRINSKYGLLQFMITHTLTIFSNSSLITSYGMLRYNNPFQRTTFNYNQLSHNYDILNDSLTSSIRSYIVNQFGSVGLQMNRRYFDLSFSFMVMVPRLYVKNPSLNDGSHLSSITVLPRGYFSYSFSDSKRIKVFLTGNQILPTVDQLQPITDNSNPLFVKVGNTNLKPGRTHGVTLSYNSIDPLKMRYFNVVFNGRVIRNQIINGIWLDSLKKQTSMPINIDGAYELGVNVDNSFPLKRIETAINVSSFLSFRRDMNFVNEVKGNNNIMSIGQSIAFSYRYKQILSVFITGSINYYRASYSNQQLDATDYLNSSFSFDGNVDLPFGFVAGSNLSYIINAGSKTGFDTHSISLNAYVSRAFLNNKKALIKLQAFDLLNQNLSVSRSIGPNYIEDMRTNVLQRYFLIGFTYFIKQKKEANSSN